MIGFGAHLCLTYSLDDAMKARVLHKLPDLEIESEAVHTWNVENYRNMERKERGPKFECGGHPWYVGLGSPSTIVSCCIQVVNQQSGEFYSSRLETTRTMRLYILNKGMMKKTNLRKDGMHASSSQLFYGISSTPHFM